MATRKLYWNEAAEGKWAEPARWRETSSSGAENVLKTVPTAEDDVILDSKSASLEIAAEAKCRSLEASAYTKTLTQAAQLKIGFSTSNAGLCLNFSAGMTFTVTGYPYIIFVSTSGTVEKITPNGHAFGPVTFEGTGGKWELLGEYTTQHSNTEELSLKAGELKTNTQMIRCYRISVEAAFTLNMKTSKVYLGAISGTVWGCASGATLTATGSTIELTGTGSALKTFTGGGHTYGSLTVAAQNVEITGANTFGTLNLNTAAKTTECKGTLTALSKHLVVTEGEANLEAGVEVTGTAIPVGTTIIKKIEAKVWELSAEATETVAVAEKITIYSAGLLLKQGETQTISTAFTTNGKSGELARLATNESGKKATLSKASVLVNANFMRLKDSFAEGGEGGTKWYAGTGSTNVANNSGWKFESSEIVKTLTAILEPKGTAKKVFALVRKLTASLEPKGTAKKVFALVRKLTASLEPKAILVKAFAIIRTFTATLTFQGALSRVFNLVKTVTAKLEFAGSLPRNIFKTLVATLRPKLAANPVEINPILDPSFEYDAEGSHSPPGWSFATSTNIKAGAVGTVMGGGGAVGSKYLRVVCIGAEKHEGVETKEVVSVVEEVVTTMWTYVRGTPGGLISVGLIGAITGGSSIFYTLTSEWTRVDFSGLSGATGTASFFVRNRNAGEAITIEIDAVSPTETYFDGDTPGYEWTGTPGDSASEKSGLLRRAITHGFQATLSFLGKLNQKKEEAKEKVEKLVASLSFVGVLPRRIAYTLTAQLSFTGTLDKVFSLVKAITASLSSLGILGRNTARALTAKLETKGTLTKVFAFVKTLNASLSFQGVLTKVFGLTKTLSAKLEFAGTLPRSVAHRLTAEVKFVGALRKTSERFAAGLAFLGSLPRNTSRNLTANLTFLGSLSRNLVRSLTATLSFIGSLPRNITHSILASLSFFGALPHSLVRNLSSALSFTGTLSRSVAHQLTAGLSFVGSLPQNIAHRLSATLSFVGTLQRQVTHRLASALSFIGFLIPQTIKNFAASLSFTGTLTKVFALTKKLTANLTFNGFLKLGGEYIERFTAALSFAGTLPKRFELVRRLTATLTFNGNLQRYVSFIHSAALLFAGTLERVITYRIFATLTFAGAIQRRISLTFISTLSFAGSLQRSVLRKLSVILTVAGTLQANVTHALSANLIFSGLIKRAEEYIQQLTASLSFVGTLPRSIRRALAASVSFSGSLGRSIVYRIEAALGAAGALQRAILHQLRAALSSEGTLLPFIPSIVHAIQATLSFSGQITRRGVIRVLQGALSFIGKLVEPGKGAKPLTDALVLKQEHAPSITLRRTESGNVYGLIDHLEGYPEMEWQSIVSRRRVFGRKG